MEVFFHRYYEEIVAEDNRGNDGVAIEETFEALLRIKHWRDKESTRDAVRLTIRDYLRSEGTGFPETYSEAEVTDKTETVFVHVFRAYPTVPSPYYAGKAS